MIREAREIFSTMTPIEIVKEFAACAFVFAMMGVLVFLSTLV